MELSSLFPIALDLPITNFHGEPTDISLKVVGPDSKQYTEVAHRFRQKLMTGKEPTADEMEEMVVHLAAASIVDWHGFVDKGAPIPYSKEKAVEFMKDPELKFVRDQVEQFTAERAKFFRKGANQA